MLKRDIKYEDFDGNEQVETFYFNISEPELVELEVDQEGGFGAWIKKIGETENHQEMVKIFKKIILLAYGQKSDDGKRFVKNDQLREEFSQTAAYQSLFMELATQSNAAADFIIGSFPKKWGPSLQKAIDEMSQSPAPQAIT